MEQNLEETFFGRSRWLLISTLVVIFALGFGIRFYDFSDPALDFHATRQLRAHLMARGFYHKWFYDPSSEEWQRQMAVEQLEGSEIIEPPLFEMAMAVVYKIAGVEQPLIARGFAIVFWMIGGLVLFLFASNLTNVDGALFALAFYTFLPFGVVASRSFQPDPLMVMWMILTWLAFYRWQQTGQWKWTILAGLSAGMALLTKNVAIFFLLPPIAAVLLLKPGLKKTLGNPQAWVLAGLAALPTLIYTLYGLWVLELGAQFEGRFFPELLRDPAHYVKWLNEVLKIMSFPAFLGGLLGMFIFKKPVQRAFLIGLWVGYGLYGLLFPYHFLTHSYYHLPLVPMVALSLAAVVDPIFARIVNLKLGLVPQLVIFVVFAFGILFQIWQSRVIFAADDYHHEPAYWEAVGEVVGHDTQIVALSQDYSNRIAYYGWINPLNWPGVGHFKYRELRGGKPVEFDTWFAEYTENMDYFLVTRIKELDRQPELKEALYNGYQIFAEGPGYLVFDLSQPLTQNP
jgi:hypothetical protein